MSPASSKAHHLAATRSPPLSAPSPVPSTGVPALSAPLTLTGARTSSTGGPNWLGRLPDEVWTLVFQHLATSASPTKLLEFLNLRFVCKLFDQLVRSEQVAYAAVLAVNGNLLLDSRRVPVIKLTDIAQSWWDVLLDQRRLDRVWLDGGINAAELEPDCGHSTATVPPGYEVLMVDVESTSSKSSLSHYDWPKASVSYSPSANRDEGVIGFLAFRTHVNDCGQPPLLPRPADHWARTRNNTGNSSANANDGTDEDNAKDDEYKEFDYITVHVLDYPSLHPITTHVLMDQGFGSLETNSDLTRTAHYPANPPTSSIRGSLSLSLSRHLVVAMGHVDKENKVYSLILTDNWDNSIIHLRSYDDQVSAGQHLQSGRTVAAVHIASSCYVTHLYLVPSEPTILRMFYIHKNTRRLHLVDLCRTSLTLVRETIVTHTEAYYFDYAPEDRPDVFILRPFTHMALVCDIRTGAILHGLRLPFRSCAFGQKVHGLIHRPILRKLDEGTARVVRKTQAVPTYAAATDSHAAPDLSRTQYIMEWVQGCEVGGDEDYLAKTNKCHARIVGVPGAAGVPLGLSHVYNEFVEPPVQSGDLLGAHVCASLSPDGDVHVADVRREGCPESEIRRVWSVGRRFAIGVRADSEVRIGQGSGDAAVVEAGGKDDGGVGKEVSCEKEFEVVVKRIGPTSVHRILCASAAEGAGSSSAELLDGAEPASADKSDDPKDQDYPESDAAGEREHGREEGKSDEEDDDDDAERDWDETSELLALGGRGNAFLIQRGPALAILRRCMDHTE